MKNFRLWWQKPRKFSDQEEERTVTFLELFYDLVYVVIIAQLSHKLAEDLSLLSFGKFAFLFLIVWCAWMNGASYHDLHGNNDIRTRVFTFLQMFTVAAMAVFAHDAFGQTAVGFAISYAAFLGIITFLWWRSGYHDPDHRPLANPYSLGCLLAALIIVAGVFLDESYRYYVWGMSLAIMVFLPLVLFLVASSNEKLREHFDQAPTVSTAMVERFGLMTIIVLGEVIVGVSQGTAKHEHLNFEIAIVALLSMLLAIGVWWLYFDFISSHSPKRSVTAESGWMYLHVPLMMGITVIGATVLNIVKKPEAFAWNEKVTLIGAVAVVYLSIALLFHMIQVPDEFKNIHQTGQRVTFVAALLSLGLLFIPLSAMHLLILLNLVMLAPIFFGARIWIKERSAKLAK